MKIEEIIQLANNKKNSLIEKKNLAYMSGELNEYYHLDEEISEVNKILEKLTKTNEVENSSTTSEIINE